MSLVSLPNHLRNHTSDYSREPTARRLRNIRSETRSWPCAFRDQVLSLPSLFLGEVAERQRGRRWLPILSRTSKSPYTKGEGDRSQVLSLHHVVGEVSSAARRRRLPIEPQRPSISVTPRIPPHTARSGMPSSMKPHRRRTQWSLSSRWIRPVSGGRRGSRGSFSTGTPDSLRRQR
jgi:hypothetical protein